MGMGKRVIIGMMAMLWAIGFLMTVLYPWGVASGTESWLGLAVLCLLMAVACYFPKSQPFISRVLGAAIFAYFCHLRM